MSVRSNSRYAEQEAEGEVELELVVLTYTGDRSRYRSNAMEQQGGYPALDGFQGPGPGDDEGETKLVVLPSQGLSWWESHNNFRIDYDEVSIAEALLGANHIPEQIVGPGFNADVRERLLGKLGIDGFTGEEDLRGQLADIAGLEPEETEQDDTARESRVDSLSSEDRSILIKVAGSYDDFDGWREENTDAAQVNHCQNTELAEFLAGQDAAEVNRRINTAEAGGDP